MIANTDWTKEIFTLKSNNLLQQNILSPVEQTHDNLANYLQDRKLNGELRDAKTPNSYLVPSYAALTAIRECVDRTIATLVNRIEKLQIKIDFWQNDQSKQNDLIATRKKLRLNKRLLTVFVALEDRLAVIPTKPDMLQDWFKQFNRQYMFAVKANMAIVQKRNPLPCLLNQVNDDGVVLRSMFNTQLL